MPKSETLQNLSENTITDADGFVSITVSRSRIGSTRNRAMVKLLLTKEDLDTPLTASNFSGPGDRTIRNPATSLIARSSHGNTYVAWVYPNNRGGFSERNLYCALFKKQMSNDRFQSDATKPVDYRREAVETAPFFSSPLKPAVNRVAARKLILESLSAAIVDKDDDEIKKQQVLLRQIGIQ